MYSLAYVVCLCVRVQSGNYPLLACRVCSHSFLLLHKQSFVFEMCQLIIQFLMEGNLDCFQSSVITVSELVNDDEYKEFHKGMIIPFLYRICQIALSNYAFSWSSLISSFRFFLPCFLITQETTGQVTVQGMRMLMNPKHMKRTSTLFIRNLN